MPNDSAAVSRNWIKHSATRRHPWDLPESLILRVMSEAEGLVERDLGGARNDGNLRSRNAPTLQGLPGQAQQAIGPPPILRPRKRSS